MERDWPNIVEEDDEKKLKEINLFLYQKNNMEEVKLPKKTYNTYWGTYTITYGEGKEHLGDFPTVESAKGAEEAYDTVFRHLGVITDIQNRKLTYDAIKDPQTYIYNKDKAELQVAAYAAEAYKRSFDFDLSMGYTIKDAETRGLKIADEMYARFMKEVKLKFPEDINKKVAERLLK